jgi:hypothetical protein
VWGRVLRHGPPSVSRWTDESPSAGRSANDIAIHLQLGALRTRGKLTGTCVWAAVSSETRAVPALLVLSCGVNGV